MEKCPANAAGTSTDPTAFGGERKPFGQILSEQSHAEDKRQEENGILFDYEEDAIVRLHQHMGISCEARQGTPTFPGRWTHGCEGATAEGRQQAAVAEVLRAFARDGYNAWKFSRESV